MVPGGSWMRIVNDDIVKFCFVAGKQYPKWEFDLEIHMHCADWALVGTSKDYLFLKFKLCLILGVLFVYMLIFT